jgi:hypothetical protein
LQVVGTGYPGFDFRKTQQFTSHYLAQLFGNQVLVFGKYALTGLRGRKSILIATQVVTQPVNVDRRTVMICAENCMRLNAVAK